MIKLPNGCDAGSTERIMLLSLWANYLNDHNESEQPGQKPAEMAFAGMGKPTYPINPNVVKAMLNYWSQILPRAEQARQLITDENNQNAEQRDAIAELNAVSDYGDPQGEYAARDQMAKALSFWYPDANLKAQDILFTCGGAGALSVVFRVISRMYPHCRIVTPSPHYSLYAGPRGLNHLHPIPVLDAPGYRLTAELLEQTIEEAFHEGHQAIADGVHYKKGSLPYVFLLCDPSNPLGTLIHPDEAEAIADVLRKYKHMLIILDEAYAEMCFSNKPHSSLLKVAPDLKDRIILMRSATKALSSAGERMAVTVTTNADLMSELIQENIDNYGHTPKSLQFAFAEAMTQLDTEELNKLSQYYSPQVKLVKQRLKDMGAELPDPNYQVEGTFYILTDLSDLYGIPMPESTKQAIELNQTVQTDEDIAYYLLFVDRIMIAPLSYFGCDPHIGYLRITCSLGDRLLTELMDRLEHRLTEARLIKRQRLLKQYNFLLDRLKLISTTDYETHFAEYSKHVAENIQSTALSALALKTLNHNLQREVVKLASMVLSMEQPKKIA
ncbi:MAG: hypothetical protein CMF50_01295 [Legionellales bacterium]|nr:hypothetical protein [Legionellales bacterium]|tara:strand:+ start:5306 stop:6970 length:1665 start_codon:yes stop_codon:yes gene_type:complete